VCEGVIYWVSGDWRESERGTDLESEWMGE